LRFGSFYTIVLHTVATIQSSLLLQYTLKSNHIQCVLLCCVCKGAVAGYIGSMLVSVWLCVGSLSVNYPTLPPVGVEGCSSTVSNVSVTESTWLSLNSTGDLTTAYLLTTAQPSVRILDRKKKPV